MLWTLLTVLGFGTVEYEYGSFYMNWDFAVRVLFAIGIGVIVAFVGLYLRSWEMP